MKQILLIPVLFLCACATKPHTYQPPNPAKLQASTGRLSKAVDKSHGHARKAQVTVNDSRALAREVREETRKLKEVPVTLIAKVNELDKKLEDASNEQALLEVALREADIAKADVEKDKIEYFKAAQGLADDATMERDKRIKAEKALSWYRWNSWIMKIVGALAVLGIIVLAFLWFTGRLAGFASKFL